MNPIVFLCLAIPLFGLNEDLFIHVNLHSYACGMFSVFNYVLGTIYHHESYAGLEVDFEDLGLYYDPEHGKNWWQYYHEPICYGDKSNKKIKTFNIDEYSYYSYFTEFNLTRHEANALIFKYFKLRPHIQEKIDGFASAYLSCPFMISVHYRGTDKKFEAPVVPYNRMIQIIRDYIKKNALSEYVLFAASDDHWFVNALQQAFPKKVVTCDWQRSADGNPVHTRMHHQYELGEEALIDSHLLLREAIFYFERVRI